MVHSSTFDTLLEPADHVRDAQQLFAVDTRAADDQGRLARSVSVEDVS